jgi:hypothetical protein
LKLVIIGFDKARLSVDPGRIDEELIAPCTPADIDTAIAEILQVVIHMLQPETVNYIKDFIKLKLPVNASKMAELNQRLTNLMVAVTGVENIVSLKPDLNFDEILIEVLKDLPAGEVSEKELQGRLQIMHEMIQEV